MTREQLIKTAQDIVDHEVNLLPAGAGIFVVITAPNDKKTFSFASNLSHKEITALLIKLQYRKK